METLRPSFLGQVRRRLRREAVSLCLHRYLSDLTYVPCHMLLGYAFLESAFPGQCPAEARGTAGSKGIWTFAHLSKCLGGGVVPPPAWSPQHCCSTSRRPWTIRVYHTLFLLAVTLLGQRVISRFPQRVPSPAHSPHQVSWAGSGPAAPQWQFDLSPSSSLPGPGPRNPSEPPHSKVTGL